jgi:ornithine cyclodeaminase/alanine dehydrogenase
MPKTDPSAGSLLLDRREIASLLTLDSCIAAVESAFRMHGEGATSPPGILGIHAADGGFHIKAGLLNAGRNYFAAKLNANFVQNAKRFRLPLIQGLLVLCDADNGYPLAVMDSTEITVKRTGAATAIAAKHLARSDSKTATICGCGLQGRIQLCAIQKVLPIEQVYAFDAEASRAAAFADDLSSELKIRIQAISEFSSSLAASDICVTCTPSTRYFIHAKDVPAGMFIAAVGADNPEKQELDPQLLASNKVVVDVLEQAATIGDLHHALEKGMLQRSKVHAELGEIVAGRKSGRTSREEITIFDSTGMALQDVASAIEVYEKALQAGVGVRKVFLN